MITNEEFANKLAERLNVQATPSPTPANLDGCPNCLAYNNPPIASATYDTTLRGLYRCRGCGHLWTTAWPAPGRTWLTVRLGDVLDGFLREELGSEMTSPTSHPSGSDPDLAPGKEISVDIAGRIIASDQETVTIRYQDANDIPREITVHPTAPGVTFHRGEEETR